MKKLITILSLFVAVSAFADFSATSATSASGWGNSSDLKTALIDAGATVQGGDFKAALTFTGDGVAETSNPLNFNDSFVAYNTTGGGYSFTAKSAKLTFQEGGYLILSRGFKAEGDVVVTVDKANSGLLLFNQGQTERRLLALGKTDTLTLNLSVKDAFVQKDATSGRTGAMALLDLGGGSIAVNSSAEQHFAIRWWSATGDLTLNLSDKMFIDDWILHTNGVDKNITIAENGLDAGALYFLKDTGVTFDADNGKITKTDGTLTQTFTLVGDIADLKVTEEVIDDVTYVKFTTALSIPEPAEWATIFGGIALALVIYRRRK